MSVAMIGVDYRAARLALRERLALEGPSLEEALRTLGALPTLSEVVVLSTCNRTEVYYLPAARSAEAPVRRAVATYLAEVAGLPVAELQSVLTAREGRAALTHLCEVAAGLQAMVVAEDGITAQVRHALQAALDAETAGAELTAVFSAALRCGKRVRTETALARADTSLAHVAIEVIRRLCPAREGRIVVVGAGKINTVAAHLLAEEQRGRLTVTSRTLAAAEELATAVGAEARPLEDVPALLAEADVVLTAVRSAQPLITAALVRAARRDRPAPLLIIDLGVPRNVAPDVAELAGVTLLDVDGLGQAQKDTVSDGDLPRAHAIVAEVVEETLVWARTREAVPVIAALRAHVDQSKDAELARTLAALSHLNQADQEAVSLLAHRLVNKMFHHLAVRMKKAAADPAMEGYLPVARYLFGVDDYPRAGEGADQRAEAGSSSLVGSQG